MCFTEKQTFACGHQGYAQHYCNDQPHSLESQRCDNQESLSINSKLLCGIGGFYCRSDQEGALIDIVYEAADITKAKHHYIEQRLMDLTELHDRLQAHFRATADQSTHEELNDAMSKIMADFMSLLNDKQITAWEIMDLESKTAAAIQHYTIVVPHAISVGGIMPALVFPTPEPRPAMIEASSLPNHMGKLDRRTRKPLSLDGITSYTSMPASRVNKPSQAMPQTHRPLPQVTQARRTFDKPKTAYLVEANIDPSTGDRSTWIKSLAQQEVGQAQEEARSQGVKIPSSPVKAKRVMKRDGARPPRTSRRKTRSDDERSVISTREDDIRTAAGPTLYSQQRPGWAHHQYGHQEYHGSGQEFDIRERTFHM